MAVTASYNRIDKYIVRAKLRQPLHTGSSGSSRGEILIHPVHGMPFVQASGIAGVFRSCYEEFFGDQAQAMELFGDNEEIAGRVRFTDGQILAMEGGMQVELRPRIRINRSTGTSAAAKGKGADEHSGQKFEIEYLGAGHEIEFSIYLYSEQPARKGTTADTPSTAEGTADRLSAPDTEEITDPSSASTGGTTGDQKRIEQVLAQIHSGQLQFGGQKSNGCGSMEILSLKHYAFDMCTAKGREDWAAEGREEKFSYTDRLRYLEEILRDSSYSARAYTISLSAKTEGSILVKSIALTDYELRQFEKKEEKEPDYVNMRNARKQYIIPGSSLKGALRAQFERIAGYMEEHTPGFDSRQVIADAFGREGKRKDTGAAGNIRVFDTVVRQLEGCGMETISNRIRIDRFTGGVMNTGLFKEQPVHGQLLIEAAIMKGGKKDDADRADRSCGLLVLTLRDLALGMFNLGSGYSVGRGFLFADRLTVRRGDGAEAEIVFAMKTEGGGQVEMTVSDPDGIITRCMQALKRCGCRKEGA